MVQRLLVVVVAAGQDHRECARGQFRDEVAERRADVADQSAAGGREAFWADESVAVVQHPDVEADLGREPRHRLPDVPAADEEQRDPRLCRQIGDALPRGGLAGDWRAGRAHALRLPRRASSASVDSERTGRVEEIAVADGQAERVADTTASVYPAPRVGQFVQSLVIAAARDRERAVRR